MYDKTSNVDTSVIGGYFDDEFSDDTVPVFERVKNRELILIVSDLLKAELLRAPQHVKELLTEIPEEQIESVKLNAEATALADRYIKDKVVGKTSRGDCQHIAMVTLHHADVLISWNFKHIVNLERIRGYNSINLRMGYPMIEIRTPKEIMTYGDEE